MSNRYITLDPNNTTNSIAIPIILVILCNRKYASDEMVAIIKQKDSRSGITYAYESVSYWDKEKKQSRAKRTLIGRVDEATDEIVPTDGRGRRSNTNESPKKIGPVPTEIAQRRFFGATYLFDAIGEKLGITKDLKICFPNHYKQLLSTAYYLITEEGNPLKEMWPAMELLEL